MNNHTTSRTAPFRPSIETDSLRPALLLAATQVMIALLGSVLLTSGVLG